MLQNSDFSKNSNVSIFYYTHLLHDPHLGGDPGLKRVKKFLEPYFQKGYNVKMDNMLMSK